MKKPLWVWCGVDPLGRVLKGTVADSKQSVWGRLSYMLPHPIRHPRQVKSMGYTVRRFRLEEDE